MITYEAPVVIRIILLLILAVLVFLKIIKIIFSSDELTSEKMDKEKPKEVKIVEKVGTTITKDKAQKIGKILIYIGIFILFLSLIHAVDGVSKSSEITTNSIFYCIYGVIVAFIWNGWIGLVLIVGGKKLSRSQNVSNSISKILLLAISIIFLGFILVVLMFSLFFGSHW